MARVVLVTGGARSGKSAWAQRRVLAAGGTPHYLATCRAEDDEMRARIARHRADRAGRGWRTVEEPLAVPDALRAAPPGPLCCDCLTLWLSNLMHAAHRTGEDFDEDVAARRGAELVGAARARAGLVVLVGNEVGDGIVPADALARRFRDCAGRLNAAVAAAADELVLMVCGVPLQVKGAAAAG